MDQNNQPTLGPSGMPPGQSMVGQVQTVTQAAIDAPAFPETPTVPEIRINVFDRAKHELCTFEMAKQASAAGMTCANTYFSYDEKGNIGDGGWLEGLGYQNFYPCINYPFAVAMLEDTDLDTSKLQLVRKGPKFILTYESEKIEATNIVDVLIMIWIRHRNIQKQQS